MTKLVRGSLQAHESRAAALRLGDAPHVEHAETAEDPLEGTRSVMLGKETDVFLGRRLQDVFLGRRLQDATTGPPGDLPPIEFGKPVTQEYHYKHNDPYYDLKNPIMGLIIGGMFAGAFLCCMLAWICRWCRRWRHRRKKKKLRKKQEKNRQKREAEKRMVAIRELENQAQGDDRISRKKGKKGIKFG